MWGVWSERGRRPAKPRLPLADHSAASPTRPSASRVAAGTIHTFQTPCSFGQNLQTPGAWDRLTTGMRRASTPTRVSSGSIAIRCPRGSRSASESASARRRSTPPEGRGPRTRCRSATAASSSSLRWPRREASTAASPGTSAGPFEHGSSREELEALVTLLAVYAGFPRASVAMEIVRAELDLIEGEQRGSEEPSA